MPSKKKVVLFLVEGPSDETAIRGPVNLLIQSSFNSDSASFHGDVTTAQIEYPTFYRIKDSIRDTVKTFVEDYLRDTNPGYKAKDIHCIVHIMDTDGAFIDDSMVVWPRMGRRYRIEKTALKPRILALFKKGTPGRSRRCCSFQG